MASNNHSDKSSYKSRRKDRAKRRDVYKEWQDGVLDDDYRTKERWSREAKKAKPKVAKKVETYTKNIRSGMVLEVHRRTAQIRLENGESLKCWYANSLDLDEFGQVAVGDVVRIAADDEEIKDYLISVEPRRSKFSRPGPRDRINSELILAANIDRVLVVCSGVPEQFNPGIIDRYLLVSSYSDLELTLFINKCDLFDEPDERIFEYENLVESIFYTSAKTGEGLEHLKTIICNGTTIFTGQSGVGKSTLIQKIIPGLDLKTREVRESDGKGKHTTTSSSLFQVNDSALVIDTPGIRELGLWKMDRDDVSVHFPGVGELVDDCKFRDCSHIKEPGCGVKAAVERGELTEARYQSYLRVLNSI